MPNCILLGARSDIGRALTQRLALDGWAIHTWDRRQQLRHLPVWDLLLCAIGTLEPVGTFRDTPWQEWANGFTSNVLTPLKLLRALYRRQALNASVCFFGGTNPAKASPEYSAYAAAKAALRMAVRDLAAEDDGLRIFMLDPGIVRTKIHTASCTYRPSNSHAGMIYEALCMCMASPEAHGRAYYVPERRWQ